MVAPYIPTVTTPVSTVESRRTDAAVTSPPFARLLECPSGSYASSGMCTLFAALITIILMHIAVRLGQILTMLRSR
mgnify:CR=1 FL=1